MNNIAADDASKHRQYFIGITRFSLYLPESSAWFLAQENEEEYLKKLFDPQRMRDRLDIFIKKSLPIYEVMSRGFFYRHVVQCSTELPAVYMKELEEIAQRYPFIFLQRIDKKGKSVESLNDILADKPDGSVAVFRVDDDDLLSVNYLYRLSKYVTESFQGMAVSFGKGYAAQYKNGRFCNFREVVSRFIAIGQCYIIRWVKESSNLNLPKVYSHNKLDEFVPTIVDSRSPAFVHTYHVNQDSNTDGDKKEILEDDIHPKLLELKRPVSYLDIPSLFPTLQDDVEIESVSGIVVLNDDRIIELAENKVVLDIELLPGCVYDVEYSLTIGKGVGIGRAAVFSVSTQDSLYSEEMKGLSLSTSPKIGYFKYLSSGGLGRGSFSFSIPKFYKKVNASIFPWGSKDYSVSNLKLKISKIG